MGHVLVEGRLLPDEDYDRGQTLVHTEEEWRHRADVEWFRERKGTVLFLVIAYLICTLPILVMDLVAGEGIRVSLEFMGWVGLLFAGCTALVLVLARRSHTRGRTLGLYRKGVQVAPTLFLPYDEVSEVRWRSQFPIPRRGRTLWFYIKHPLKPSASMRTDAVFQLSEDFLGDEAVRTLAHLLEDEHSITIS